MSGTFRSTSVLNAEPLKIFRNMLQFQFSPQLQSDSMVSLSPDTPAFIRLDLSPETVTCVLFSDHGFIVSLYAPISALMLVKLSVMS